MCIVVADGSLERDCEDILDGSLDSIWDSSFHVPSTMPSQSPSQMPLQSPSGEPAGGSYATDDDVAIALQDAFVVALRGAGSYG
jgi:hypothetical protein